MSHTKYHRRHDKDIIEYRKPSEARKRGKHKHRKILNYEEDDESENYCRLKLTNSKMLTECTSKLVIERNRQGFIAVKLPVIITEVTVNINIQNAIQFTRNVINLVSVKRRVILKQCRLIAETNKLFFNGIVIKSIEYNEETFHGSGNSKGRIKNMTINIPFQCVTSVEYINDPQMGENKTGEPKVFKMVNGEQTFVDSYREIDEIYCELVKVNFNELNINDCNDAVVTEQHIHTFRKLKQKMVMTLTLRLFQKQIVFIKKS